MFKDDDDGDEDVTFNVTRYPCMPSLVALQQMRNRLHLANLGRKLMKWTALATGSELRHIAAQIDVVYRSFSEDMRNAYILLARSRYFYPNLNKMVTEGCPNKADISLLTSTRNSAGVKIMKYDIVENNSHPYAHLGIEKGGQTILDTKKAWLELLKRIIVMVELRTNFTLVENMHKGATKKMNVLGKVVIPKTKATCTYIISSLEELARDEFYRRKMILEVKDKRKRSKEVKEEEPPEPKEIVEEPVAKSDTNVDRTSLLNSLREYISEILEKINTMDESAAENFDIEECLAIGEELKNKLDASLKSDSECCSELISMRSDLDSDTNKTVISVESNIKILPLDQFYTPEISNFGTFQIVVKESTRVERTLNKDGTVKEEKKIIRVRKVYRSADGQSSTPQSMSYTTISSKDEITSTTSRETSGSSSKSSKSPKTTIQMIRVNDWLNRKLRNNSSIDFKLWAGQVYGETSKCNAYMHCDELFFTRYYFPSLDGKYLKHTNDSSFSSVPDDDEYAIKEIQDSHIPLLNFNEKYLDNNAIENYHQADEISLPLAIDKEHFSQDPLKDNESECLQNKASQND